MSETVSHNYAECPKCQHEFVPDTGCSYSTFEEACPYCGAMLSITSELVQRFEVDLVEGTE